MGWGAKYNYIGTVLSQNLYGIIVTCSDKDVCLIPQALPLFYRVHSISMDFTKTIIVLYLRFTVYTSQKCPIMQVGQIYLLYRAYRYNGKSNFCDSVIIFHGWISDWLKGPGVHYFNNSSTSDEGLASLGYYKIIVIENCKRKQQFHEKFDWKAEMTNVITNFKMCTSVDVLARRLPLRGRNIKTKFHMVPMDMAAYKH